jgi:hypothetical protein
MQFTYNELLAGLWTILQIVIQVLLQMFLSRSYTAQNWQPNLPTRTQKPNNKGSYSSLKCKALKGMLTNIGPLGSNDLRKYP